MIIVSLFSIT